MANGIFQDMLQNMYQGAGAQTPQQQQNTFSGIMGGALQGVAPFMGQTTRPNSMAQVLAGAAGGMTQGMNQSRQNNLQMQEAERQKQLYEMKIKASTTAAAQAAAKKKGLDSLADKLKMPRGTPESILQEVMKARTASGKFGTPTVIADPASSTGYSNLQISQDGTQRVLGPAKPPTSMYDPNAAYKENNMKVLSEAQTSAGVAGQSINALKDFKSMMASGVPTGSVASLSLPARQFLAGFGVEDPNIPIQEAMVSVENKLALQQHQPGMGPMTDPDFERYRDIGPRLSGTKAGNILTIRRLEREAIGKEMYAEEIQKQLESGASMVNQAQAWKSVRSRLDSELGEFIPTVTQEEVDSGKFDGLVVVLNGVPGLVE